MNANDYGSLPNKKTSTDSGFTATDPFIVDRSSAGISLPVHSYAPRENGMVNSYQNMQSTSRLFTIPHIEWQRQKLRRQEHGYPVISLRKILRA
jgi:hypothetical protein